MTQVAAGAAPRRPAVPELSGRDATLEAFLEAYGRCQAVLVRASSGRPQRTASGRGRLNLPVLRRLFAEHSSTVRRAFSVESGGAAITGDALEATLGARKAPEGSWYASFVAQRRKAVLEALLKAAKLPKGAPEFLLGGGGKRGAVRPRHSNAIWVFFGSNPSRRPLQGRPEHTDAVAHSGTWHVQLQGSKVWTLRPTRELLKSARLHLRGAKGAVRVHCRPGDVLVVNTHLWWHQTHIPAGCQLSLSLARDMYLDGRPTACNMTNVEGHYATRPIAEGRIIFSEEDAPNLQLPRSADANCSLRELDGRMVVVAKKRIKAGEWFSLSDSEAEEEEPGPPARKRRRS